MKTTLTIIALVSVMLLSSCKLIGNPFDPRKDAKNYISIHPVSNIKIDSSLYKKLVIGEHTIYVHTVAMITNKDIYEAKAFEQENGLYGIEMSLAAFGQRVWRQVTTNHAGDKAVLTIDGKYHCVVQFDPFYDPSRGDTVKLYSNMTEAQADQAAEFVKYNYELFN